MKKVKTETLERIDPRLFRAYLKQQGWQYNGNFRDVEEYWKKDGHNLTLPLGTDKRDYALRISEAVTILSETLPMTMEHIVAMMATGRVKNWLIAGLIEPDLEPLTEEEKDAINPPITFSRYRLSPEEAHYIVTVWEEQDEPRWEPINFTGHFDSAVWAYEKLRPGFPLYTSMGDDHEAKWVAMGVDEDEGELGRGDTASEAICNLILELGEILD